jgi:hypothetical protein
MGLLKGLFIFCLALIIGVLIGVDLENEYHISHVFHSFGKAFRALDLKKSGPVVTTPL